MATELCPKCNGQGIVSKPPYLAGDINEWSSSESQFTCNLCNGKMVIDTEKDGAFTVPVHLAEAFRNSPYNKDALRGDKLYWQLEAQAKQQEIERLKDDIESLNNGYAQLEEDRERLKDVEIKVLAALAEKDAEIERLKEEISFLSNF